MGTLEDVARDVTPVFSSSWS
ncbi:hypothetical protein SPHINGOT1_620063 [Sphingomonas sp. T1]|nr:hypothetical protein SPHINGOT1_620063 [Sphingomonas sp. T1]